MSALTEHCSSAVITCVPCQSDSSRGKATIANTAVMIKNLFSSSVLKVNATGSQLTDQRSSRMHTETPLHPQSV